MKQKHIVVILYIKCKLGDVQKSVQSIILPLNYNLLVCLLKEVYKPGILVWGMGKQTAISLYLGVELHKKIKPINHES
jgi:hypothetical protein